MKIAVQRQIIDTDNIYSVGEEILENSDKEYYFIIQSFNEKELYVSINFQYRTPSEVSDNPMIGELDYDDWKKFMSDLKIINKNRLEKMRQDIIKLWAKNQTNIPIFDIKNY